MDQKLKEKLDPLPGKDDAFWPKEAENKRIELGPAVTCEKGGHYFVPTQRALEVKCKKCPAGYVLSAGWEVKDGHIYIGQELVV